MVFTNSIVLHMILHGYESDMFQYPVVPLSICLYAVIAHDACYRIKLPLQSYRCMRANPVYWLAP